MAAVHAQQPAAYGAGPFFRLVLKESVHSGGFYILQVFKDVCVVFGAVSFLQRLHAGAGVFIALITEARSVVFNRFAVFYDAPLAGGTGSGALPASRAGVFFPLVPKAERAVDAAGRDHGRGYDCLSVFHNVPPDVFLFAYHPLGYHV
jgi:hypothetical protein